jgi:hypothetical protein
VAAGAIASAVLVNDGSFGLDSRLHLSVVPEQLMARGVTFPVALIVPTSSCGFGRLIGALRVRREVRTHLRHGACRALITRSDVEAIHNRRGGNKLRRLLWALCELGGAEEFVNVEAVQLEAFRIAPLRFAGAPDPFPAQAQR